MAFPKVLAGDMESLTPRQQGLRLVLGLVPRSVLQNYLYFVTWGNPHMERRAFNLFRGLSNPEDLDLFVKLQLLDGMSDPGVRADFAAWTRAEHDPKQRSRLAAIAGRQWRYDEFLPLIEELMSDSSDAVVAAVLERFHLKYDDRKHQPEFRKRTDDLMILAAGSSRSESVRVNALRGLRNAEVKPTRFLLDVVARDRNDRVVCAAIGALPDGFDIDEPGLAVEMIRLLYSIATDPSRDSQVRFSAAWAADVNDLFEGKILSPGEQETVERIISEFRDK